MKSKILMIVCRSYHMNFSKFSRYFLRLRYIQNCARIRSSSLFQENLLRTYKGQGFTKDNFQSKNLVKFLFSRRTQILNSTKNCGKCQLRKVPVRGSASLEMCQLGGKGRKI